MQLSCSLVSLVCSRILGRVPSMLIRRNRTVSDIYSLHNMELNSSAFRGGSSAIRDDMSVSKISKIRVLLKRPPNSNILNIKTPEKGTPTYRNRNTRLIRPS